MCSESAVWLDRQPHSLFCVKVKLQPLVCTHCVLSRGELQGTLDTAVILGFSPYKLYGHMTCTHDVTATNKCVCDLLVHVHCTCMWTAGVHVLCIHTFWHVNIYI